MIFTWPLAMRYHPNEGTAIFGMCGTSLFSNTVSLVCFNKCSARMKHFTSTLGNNQIGR